MEKRKPIVKRQYLRSGCKECKRRKIKCNEARPVCGKCARIGKECEYPVPKHEASSRRPNRGLRLRLVPDDTGETAGNGAPKEEAAGTGPAQLAAPESLTMMLGDFGGGLSEYDLLLFDNVFDDANTLVHGLADFESLLAQDGMDMTGAHGGAGSNGSQMNQAETGQNGSQMSLSGNHEVGASNGSEMSPDGGHSVGAGPNGSHMILNGPHMDPSGSELDFKGTQMETAGSLSLPVHSAGSLVPGTPNGSAAAGTPNAAGSLEAWEQFQDVMRGAPVHETNAQLAQQVIDTYDLASPDRDYFLDFVLGPLLHYFFPFAPKTGDCRVMRTLLEYLKVLQYMVYAMMAVLALCTFTSTGQPPHDTYQRQYTASCMRLIVAAFLDLRFREHGLLLWHIEGLILTVVLLTMMFCDIAFVDTQQAPVLWMLHLQEVRALLIKYMALQASSAQQAPDLAGITIAKQLFFCYDWTSKMYLPAQLLTQDDLADLWRILGNPNVPEEVAAHSAALARMDLVIPASASHSDYYMFSCLLVEVIKTVHQVFQVIRSATNPDAADGGDEPGQASPEAIASIMVLLDRALKEKIVPDVVVDRYYRIPVLSAMHPLQNSAALPECAYGKDTDNVLQPCYLWCDVALRLHIYSLYLKILTSKGLVCLPRGHPLLCALLRSIMGLMFFLKPRLDDTYRLARVLAESEHYFLPACLFDHRAIMVQLAFRLCIELTDSEADFEKLELYFRGLVRLGCGNGTMVIARIDELREKAKERRAKNANPDYAAALEYNAEIFHIY